MFVLAMDYFLAMLYFVLSAGNLLYFSPQIQKTILTQTPLAGEMAVVCQKKKWVIKAATNNHFI